MHEAKPRRRIALKGSDTSGAWATGSCELRFRSRVDPRPSAATANAATHMRRTRTMATRFLVPAPPRGSRNTPAGNASKLATLPARCSSGARAGHAAEASTPYPPRPHSSTSASRNAETAILDRCRSSIVEPRGHVNSSVHAILMFGRRELARPDLPTAHHEPRCLSRVSTCVTLCGTWSADREDAVDGHTTAGGPLLMSSCKWRTPERDRAATGNDAPRQDGNASPAAWALLFGLGSASRQVTPLRMRRGRWRCAHLRHRPLAHSVTAPRVEAAGRGLLTGRSSMSTASRSPASSVADAAPVPSTRPLSVPATTTPGANPGRADGSGWRRSPAERHRRRPPPAC